MGVVCPGGCLFGGVRPGVVCLGVSAREVSAWGGSAHGGLPRGGLPRGVSAWVCVYPSMQWGRHPPPLWTEFLIHACENINFSQLLLRTVMIKKVGIRILRSQFVKNNLRYRASRTYHPVCCRYRRVELGSPGEKLRPRPEPASPETKHVRLVVV